MMELFTIQLIYIKDGIMFLLFMMILLFKHKFYIMATKFNA